MQGRPTTPHAVNKQERTYTVLRDRIHSGAFAPQARLNIDALARELGVSAIPVREALRRLEAEGWVKFQPNVGAIVAPLDATAWEQQMVAVAILEARPPPTPRAPAPGRLRQGPQAGGRDGAGRSRGRHGKFSRLNRRLHATIIARCPTPTCSSCSSRPTSGWTASATRCSPTCPSGPSAAVGEHEHLIELLEDGDPAEIERYARWHKLQTVEAYRATHAPPG
jgi:DNA-binding GntR family transcriptional regulator